jgi:hypothetical protein
MATDSMAPRAPRTPLLVIATGALGVLLAFAGAYYLTHEPAPLVRVRWREGLSAERRAELEHRFLLVRPVPHEGRTMSYDLLDTRRSNVEALLRAPEVEDTAHIDRAEAVVPFDAPYGESWMWIGHRTPVVRGLLAPLR